MNENDIYIYIYMCRIMDLKIQIYRLCLIALCSIPKKDDSVVFPRIDIFKHILRSFV